MAEESRNHTHTTANSPAPRARSLNPFMGILVDHGWALLLALVLILLGVLLASRSPATADLFMAAGLLGIVIVLALAPIAFHLRRNTQQQAINIRKIDNLVSSIHRLGESSMLSDDARRVLNRGAERDMLCKAIEEDIQAQAWDAAMVLCDELAQRFGYRQDAEEFRARIELARSEIQERKVADAIARLDGLIVQKRWDVAAGEARRIQRLFPDSPRVERLRDRVEQARLVYKSDLERRFLDAAQNDRVDDAMSMLKELDAYLTEEEAAPLREAAKGVIGKARENLGTRFKLAVQDRQWAQAAALGRRITAEFPNTRMAQEVRGMMDGILAKANSGEPAATR